MIGRRYAATEMARRLIAAGHGITFAAPDIGRTGTWPTGAKNIELPDYRLGGPAIAPPASWHDYLPWRWPQRTHQGAASLSLSTINDLLAENDFDLVLIDFELHPHIILSLAASKNVALFADMFAGPAHTQAPPLDSMIVPGRGLSGTRAGVALAWATLWLRLRWYTLKTRIKRAGGDYPAILRALAHNKAVALPANTSRWRWQYPFAWHRLPLLVIQGQAFDFPKPPARLIRYVGPMRPPADDLTGDAGRILERARQARQNGKRIVFIGFGSILKQRPDLVARLWGALATQPDWHVIHAVGGATPAPHTPPPPPNIELTGWAPQKALLQLADLAVIHAGINTITECIQAQVPMLCIPQVNDQAGGAARVVFHGLGTALPPDAPADLLLAQMTRLIADDDIRRRCDAMQQRFAADQSGQVLERVIEELLTKGAKQQ